MKAIASLLALAGVVSGEVYFKDTFESDPFAENRWSVSTWKQDTGEAGKLEWSGGLWGAKDRKGIRTSEDARFYAVTAKMDKEFDNSDKDLVFQFSVKHEQKIDCGGGYVKLLPADVDVSGFNGETAYSVMFGPDICGYSTKKVHAILNKEGENMEKKSEVKCPDDAFTHVYTLILKPDDTYEIRVDGESKDSGNIKEAWDFEAAKEIKDPDASKPEDWVDDEMMDDPNDVKPDDWDDEPEKIADPEASKPEDWDDEEDGEWEAPMIDNPEYKGEWKPKRIENPEYKGKWEHPMIANPDYVEYKDAYKRGNLGYLGLEVWQVKSGTVFSNFIVTDNVEEAEAFAEQTKVERESEEASKKEYDEANRPKDDDEDDDDEDVGFGDSEFEDEEMKEEL